ncbi:MAG: dephospho-CoA kinase [Solobacterium sp.]|nr:dephospho-CoA kinase [Solobacterium sp.]
MKRVCITGTIGAGKSTVAYLLRRRNFAVFDADGYSRICLLPTHQAYQALKEQFPASIFDENGEVNRKELAKLVFEEEEKRIALNAIIHPYVKEGMLNYFHKNQEKEIVFAEVPLVFEAGWENEFDCILVVTCEKETAIKRLMDDRHYTKEEAIARLSSQQDPATQIAKADIVLHNDGTIKELDHALAKVLQEVKKGKWN